MGERIVIAGGPRCGKTTLAAEAGPRNGSRVLHTDDLIGKLDWSAASAECARWFAQTGPWIVEGVAAARALRKWLEQNRAGKPCDVVVHMTKPFVTLTTQQAAMLKGCGTVWSEISAELRTRGCRIETPNTLLMRQLGT